MSAQFVKKMEKEVGLSTSQNLDIDFGERSFVDENFKGKFTNALLAARCIFEEHNLLTNNLYLFLFILYYFNR